MDKGYNFYFSDGDDVLTFPITPGELTIKSSSNNEVVNLINEGDINILKSPSLTEIEFEARFPMRQYPYAREFTEFKTYFDKFKELKEQKKSFRFIVARSMPNGKRTWDTNLLVSLEDFELVENAEDGDDVLMTFKLKQFKEYGTVTLKNKDTSTSTSATVRPQIKKEIAQSYKVIKGDNLWNIAKKAYGSGSEWKTIYEANKITIESSAKSNGKESSSNGHWIYPGTELIIPKSNK